MSNEEEIKMLINTRTGQIMVDNYVAETIFSKYKESDFLQLGKYIWYHYHVQPPIHLDIPNSDRMDLNLREINGYDVFSAKAQQWVRVAANVALSVKYYKNALNPVKPDDNALASAPNVIGLRDFSAANNGVTLGYTDSFVDNINTFKDLNGLNRYARNTGYLTKNLMYLYGIKESVINLEEIFKELSNNFDNSTTNIKKKSQKFYEGWRNDIIQDTLQNFKCKKVNKDFMAFLLLHMFKLCKDEFNIIDVEELIMDGRKRKGKGKLKKILQYVDEIITEIERMIKNNKNDL